MLANLVNNAIKFTAKGVIHISAKEVSRTSHTAILEFSVQDTGTGIAEDKQSLLFKDFSQVDSSVSRQYGGTGLGLSIVLQLSQLMNGKVGCESTLGQGSRFWFQVTVDTIKSDQMSTESHNSIKQAQPINQHISATREGMFILTEKEQHQIKQLVRKLDDLLAENMFGAINCFKELKNTFKDDDILQQLIILEGLINEMNFDQARHFLNEFVKQLNLDSKSETDE